ncbi:MAG: SAM-dependent methyltransferase [Rhodobacterales bacterium]|nr:MAG: SAM-dependent methyltransferase [Rhodobacterales bacterium]
MTDARTLAFYSDRAGDYAQTWGQTPGKALRSFIAALPDGARVLDLGCGPGHASAHMAAAGLRPDPVDAAPGMVDEARAKGLPARLMRFDELDADQAYDGVWANFSLTHAPRDALPSHLAAIAKALKPGGALHIGVKTGDGPHRDTLGRLYHLIPADALVQLVEAAGMTVTQQREGKDMGFDGQESDFVVLRAVRNG